MASFKKKIKEYEEIYGDVPLEYEERLHYLLDKLKFKESEIPFLDKMYNKLRSTKKETLRFILYLIPEPSPRPRSSGLTHRFYVKGARENNNLFYEILSQIESMPLITTATEVKLISYLPTPSSMNRFEKFFAELGYVHALSIPDWDNLAKTYCDMIQKNLLINDSLIWKGESTKFYSIKPRIDLELTFARSYDCTYNRKRMENSKVYLEADKEKFDKSLETVLRLS